MYGLLRPTTLAAIVADLRLADRESWIANDEERQDLEDAECALENLVGREEMERLIQAEEASHA